MLELFLRRRCRREISGKFPGNLHVPDEKHFPEIAQSKQGNSCQGQPAEHKVDYEGTAVEYKERHSSGGMGGHSTAMCCMCVQSHSVALILCTVDLILVR